jgi:sialidase-1
MLDPVPVDELPIRYEGDRDTFLAEPTYERTVLFDSGRFPNLLVTTDGTVLATWGGYNDGEVDNRVRTRRSVDGGASWGSEIDIGEGRHGGGALVDETTGDVLVAVNAAEHGDPEYTMYRSRDDGETWSPVDATIHPDANGNVPSLHMAEHGITLRRGPRAGRLLRPARVYGNDGYNTALYSDDGGETWNPSKPYPDRGTGEGAVVELSDGRIYYSSRKHYFEDTPYRAERQYALSTNAGEKWGDLDYDDTLPDGPRYRSEDGRGAVFNGHFGMMAGLMRLPISGEDVLVYSNADNAGYQRRDLTVWASFDGGDTWPVKRRIYDPPSAYSSLTAGRPGTPSEGWIYCLFEHGEVTGDGVDAGDFPTITQTGGTLARFTLPWLARGTLTGDGVLPDWIDR